MFSFPGNSLLPGSRMEGWSCTSEFLPGWITAYSGGGADTQLPNAPFEVDEQLSKIRPFERYFQAFLTFGPKYPVEAPALVIALDFLHGLSVMEDLEQLTSSRTFLATVKAHLQKIVAEEEVAKLDNLRPFAGFEAELLRALTLSLPKYF